VVNKLVPSNNSFVFFQVSPESFHQVGEVTSEKTRLSIGGWFHGESLPRPVKPSLQLEASLPYIEVSEDLFFGLVNPVYLDPQTQGDIQEKFEESSEISLPDFFAPEKYSAACEVLKAMKDWKQEGPPNRRSLQSFSCYEGNDELRNIFDLMRSEPFFLLLSNLTGLRLHSLAPEDSDSEEQSGDEHKEINPTWKGRIRKLDQGSFTLVRDDDLGQCEFGLDARVCFNVAPSWDAAHGGQTIYIARGEDEELVTVEPENNSLNLVYRDKESLKFTKYVNSGIEESGPFYDLDFSYYE